jgi:hypothetical protein
MADAPAPKRSRLPRILLALVVVSVVVTVAYVALLNRRKDGVFSFRVFDAAWWRPGMASAQPVIDGAKSATAKANEALWGAGGVVDQAERWLDGKVARSAPATSGAAPAPAPGGPVVAPAVPTAPDPDVVTAKRCEQKIADAEIDFQVGLDHYRRANPQGNVLTAAQRDHLREARTRFLSAKDLLDRTLETYADCSAHDKDRLADGKALRDYDERLLVSLTRVIDEAEPAR